MRGGRPSASPASSSASAAASSGGDSSKGGNGGSDDGLPVALDPSNCLAGSGHSEDNEDTNVTAAEEADAQQAVARSSKRQRKAPSKYDD